MTKRSRVSLFGLLALVAAFGLILTGCPDAGGSGGSSGPGPIPTVTLEASSQGTAGTGAITGLEAGKQYLVKVGTGASAQWYTVTEEAELSADPLEALTVEAADETAPLEGTVISGLDNSKTYSVYLYGVLANGKGVGDSEDAGDVVNGGKNAVLNISALAATQTAKVLAGAGTASAPSTLIFLIDSAVTEQRAYPEVALGAQTDIQGLGENALNFSFNTTEADSAKVQAKAGEAFITVSNVGAETATTITATASATKTRLSAGSQGAVGDTEITVPTGWYLVYNHSTAKWYTTVTNATTLAPLNGNGVLSAVNLSGVSSKGAISGGSGVTITELTNGVTYDVYAYKVLEHTNTVGGAASEFTPTLNNGGKNAVLNISDLGNDKSVSVKAGAGADNARSTLIFLTGVEIQVNAIGNAQTLANLEVQNAIGAPSGIGSPLYYYFSSTIAGGAEMQAIAGTSFITLSNVGAGTVTNINIANSTDRVFIKDGSPASGSTGTPAKIIVEQPGWYLVYNHNNGKWYTTNTADTGLVELGSGGTAGVLSAGNITAIATAGIIQSDGEEITGLENGTTYSVYLYKELAAGDQVGTSASPGLVNDGVNAVLDISALEVGDSVSVLAGAGVATAADKPNLIFLIADTVLEATAIPSAATLGTQEIKNTRILPANPLIYGFSVTTPDDAKVEAKADEAFITLSEVGADTATTLSVIGTKLAAGSQGTAGDGEITGLTESKTYLVKSGANWYPVTGTGLIGASGNLATAITNKAALNSGVTAITGLENGVEYDVYAYATSTTAIENDSYVTAEKTKNAVAHLTSSANGTVTISAGFGTEDAVKKLVVILDGPIVAENTTQVSGSAPGNTVDAVNATKLWTFSSYGNIDSATVNFTVNEEFLTVTTISNTTAFTLTQASP